MPLKKDAAQLILARIASEFGTRDRQRLSTVTDLLDAQGTLNVGRIIAVLWPDKTEAEGLAALGQLRLVVKNAAANAGSDLRLCIDTKKRDPALGRTAWFEGASPYATALAEQSDKVTVLARRSEQEAVVLSTDLEVARAPRRTVRYFVSYAHADTKLVGELLMRLKRRFDSAARFEFVAWSDENIEPGELWHEAIQSAIARCDFGLLFVSHAFLASRYITAEELRHFVAAAADGASPTRRAIPIAIEGVSFDGETDMRGLERLQFLPRAGRQVYEACRGGPGRNAFADEVFRSICKLLGGLPGPGPGSLHPALALPTRSLFDHEARLGNLKRAKNPAARSSMDKLDDLWTPEGERRDVMDLLLEWLADPDGRPYGALLGEYGMGKTTTCMALTQTLARQRQTDAERPTPLYLDLRLVGQAAQADLTLEAIIERILARSWRSGDIAPPPPAAEVIRMVRDEGALVIFDGLDEVLVHLSPAHGRQFVREIFRILPPELLVQQKGKEAREVRPGRRGRLLISCRNHFFRSLRDQKAFLTAEGRDHIAPNLYFVLQLLPFEAEQVHECLTLIFDDGSPAAVVTARVDRVLALVAQIHNLKELSQRPYLLSLIAEQATALERWRQEGRRVSGVDLYRHMVLSWLERDGGKHALTPDHKQAIMEQVAATLHRSGAHSWKVEQLETWLLTYLDQNPQIAAHYAGVDRELLKEDLRTATFLVRVGDDEFRFAHTSLEEYFLAAFLHRALIDHRPEAWAMATPSVETLDFLGQLVLGDPSAEDALEALLETYRPRASELAVAYALFAAPKGYPAPSLAGASLEGAQLRELVVRGRPGQPVSLRGAKLQGAALLSIDFRHVDLSEADLAGADLDGAVLIDCTVTRGHLRNANLSGATFRTTTLSGADLTGAIQVGAEFVGCDLGGVAGCESTIVALEPPGARARRPPPAGARLEVYRGHGDAVRAVAYDGSGRLCVSGDGGGTIILWDHHSGRWLRVFKGSPLGVNALAFRPDGAAFAAGGYDMQLQLWSVGDGALLWSATGEGSISAVAFSPDGRHVATGSGKGVIEIWDATTGDLRKAFAHDRPATPGERPGQPPIRSEVFGLSYSRDGQTLFEASYDHGLRLWNVETATCVADLREHSGAVTCIVVSPDGGQVATGSYDQTVRIWDVAERRSVLTLKTSDAVNAVAYAPDGARVAAGSKDGSVRIWTVSGGRRVGRLQAAPNVASIAFSRRGGFVTGSYERCVQFWREATWTLRATRSGRRSWAGLGGFSPSGTYLACPPRAGRVAVWNTETGRRTFVAKLGSVPLCTAVSDDGALAVQVTSGELLVLQADGARAERQLDRLFKAFAVSPCGTQLAAFDASGEVSIIGLERGDVRTFTKVHRGAELIAYAPDGRTIVTSALRGTVVRWDAASGDILQRWPAPPRLRSIALDAEGKVLLLTDFGAKVLYPSGESLPLPRPSNVVLNGRRTLISSTGAFAALLRDGSVRVERGDASFLVVQMDEGAAAFSADQSILHFADDEAWVWLRWVGQRPDRDLWSLPVDAFGPNNTGIKG